MNQRWLDLECLGKGLCTGLLAVAALQPTTGPALTLWGFMAAGLLAGLGWAAVCAPKTAGIEQNRRTSSLLFLLLEHPAQLYGAIVVGALAGAATLTWGPGTWTPFDLGLALGVGVGLGLLFAVLRRLPRHIMRTTAAFVVAAVAVAAVLYYLESQTTVLDGPARSPFGIGVLLVVPLLTLLTFVGRNEETQAEAAAAAAALAIGLWALVPGAHLVAVAIPAMLYLAYTQMWMRKLASFKQALRGNGYLRLGQIRPALAAYRRALQLVPANPKAREGLWEVHRRIDLHQLLNDPETLALIDVDLCLERAKGLLLSPAPPTAEQIDEALKLLTLILDQRPTMQPVVYYWRAVAHTHARAFEKAEEELRTVLDPSADGAEPNLFRSAVLLPAWQLALVQHRELKRRVGEPLLNREGRRFDAITAVERTLDQQPNDADAWELKRLLYADATEAEYDRAAGPEPLKPVRFFDHAYALQQAQTLLEDPARWRRGAELLRMAVRGQVADAPVWYTRIAQTAERNGDGAAARQAYETGKRIGQMLGVKNLSADAQAAYFATIKLLAERAAADGNFAAAIANYNLYAESPESGQDTLRILAELYEKQGDVVNALLTNERCLVYDAKNATFLERKDRYYYSLMPADLSANKERLQSAFDLGYCLRKGRTLLDHRGAGPEQIDWALHLAQVALAFAPDNMPAKALAGRAYLRRGEEDAALPLLEDAREAKDQATGDAEDTWYLVTRLLADIYLTRERPDLAVLCLKDYRSSPKSGAETLYKMGQAYERLGDRQRATKCYENVTAYDNPLSYEAQNALQRLTASVE